MHAFDIAVIGAGLSGSLTVINLLNASTKPLRIGVFEREARRVGRGVAYSNAFDYQPLNVNVEGMTLYASEPLHFYNWLNANNTRYKLPDDFSTKSFVSRRWFGDYLQHELATGIAAHPQHTVQFVQAEVNAASRTPKGIALVANDGRSFQCRRVVLALGNFPPSTIPSDDLNYVHHPHYEPNPWRDGLLEAIGPEEKVLFVGAGLTMIDLLINLKEQGHRNMAYVISRSGLLPSLHQPYERKAIAWNTDDFHQGLLHLLKTVRSRIKSEAANGVDWRCVVDSLREHTPRIWRALSPDDKRMFFRRLRAYWDMHRHRVPPFSHGLVQDFLNGNKARLLAGRIQNIRQHNDGFLVSFRLKHSAGLSEFFVHRIVNCTGPESNFKNLNQALVRNLLYQGFVQQDSTALGLLADADGRLIDTHQRAQDDL
ncbi:MAG TPA: FAD/NAD(P)-binding protein, partial [Chitinophagales bacterium]|nr:FAD/NAD(P)-binding protein [Chitinophagales bacterium]